MAAQDETMKRPASTYFLWLNANRDKIQTMCGCKDFKTVGAKASELWKAATTEEKAPFDAEAQKQKEAWNHFKETDAGKAALEAKQTHRKEQKVETVKKSAKLAVKSVEKNDKLKKPMSAYFMWCTASREKIVAELGDLKKGSEVTKKGAQMWNALTEEEKAPWDQKYKAAKEEHEKYLASEEGTATMNAYKDAMQTAKAEVTKSEPETKPQPKERVKRQAADVTPEKPAKKPRVARAAFKAPLAEKPAKVQVSELLSQEMVKACEAAQQKCKDQGVNFEALLRKLLDTQALADKGLTAERGLAALEKSSGLLNQARGILTAELGA